MKKEQNQIDISVKTQYLADRLPETEDKFAFAYQITIENKGSNSVTLLNRYWLITDGNGKKTEVAGEGVIGEQPNIAPGKSFRYTSGAVLDTPVGTMQGHYEFRSVHCDLFTAPIDVFGLAVPNLVN